jgi:hypothetical protein
MSWDLFIQDWGSYKNLDEIPDNYNPSPIGTRTEIIRKIKGLIPEVNFSDPSFGVLDMSEFSIEFNMGEDEEQDSFILHVRGNEKVVPLIAHILKELELKAADGSDELLEDFESLKEAYERWTGYRDEIFDNK